MQFATPSNRRARHSFCILHSAFCIVHYALCISFLVAFAARAEIPATLEKDTAYVVDGETGAGPAAIYVENASLSLVNGAKLDFTSTKCATDKQGGGTNFFLHVAGGSTVTNYPSIGTRSGARLVVEDGSQIHYRASNTPVSSRGNRDIVLAFTNSLFNAAGKVNINIQGDNTLLALCSSRIVGAFTLQTYGHDNRIVFSGNSTATMTIALFNGTNNWVVVEDGGRLVSNGIKLQNYSSGTNGFHVGRGAFLYGNMSQAATARNGRLIVEEDGEYAMQNGDGTGFQGIDCTWTVNDGTISCSNNMLRICNGSSAGSYSGLRLELNGTHPLVLSRNLQVGNEANSEALTVVLRPGPDGFSAAPLSGRGSLAIYQCIFDVDLREPLRRTPPNAVLRLPVANATSTLTLTDANLAVCNALLRSTPAGATLVKEGKTLYCQIKNKATTMLMVR